MQNQPSPATTATITNPPGTPTPQPAPTSAAAARGPGRPTACTNEAVQALCDVIRAKGLTDTSAALRIGIAASTLTDWKRKHPDLAIWLGRAREEFREAKLGIIDEATTSDGRADWRA